MLGKVMKYEYKAMGTQLLPLCGLALATACSMRLIWWLSQFLPWQQAVDFMQGFTTSVTTVLLLALLLLSVVIVAHRFYASLTGSEAYLTFTLPVKTGTLLAGRVLTGATSLFGSILVAVLGGFAFYTGLPNKETQEVGNFPLFSASANGSGATVRLADLPMSLRVAFVAVLVLVVLVAILFLLCQLYTAIAIGSQFGHARVLFSVIFYFVLNWVQGFAVVLLAGIPIGIFMGAKEGIVGAKGWFSAMSVPAMVQEGFRFLMLLLGVVMVACLLVSAVYYLVCRRIFTKRLNLE